VAGCDPAGGADDEGRGRCAGVLAADDDAAAGTDAATGDVTTDGVPAVPPIGRPWLGDTASTTIAVAAATATSAIAPVIMPVRKLISSSRALTAARMPGHEPTAWCSPPYTPPDDTDESRLMAA
jgi:hypothetical protein